MERHAENSGKRLWSRFLQDAMDNSPEFNAALNKEKQLFRELAEKGELGKCVTVMCCGDGREVELLLDLQKEFPQLRELNGVDILSISIDQVREKVREKMQQIHDVSLYLHQEDATATSIRPDSQDTVMCMLTMVNFNDEFIAKLCTHVEHILKPGGKFIFSVYNDTAYDARMNLYTKTACPIEKADPESGLVVFEKGFDEAAFSRQFSKEEIQDLMRSGGLHSCYYDGAGITHMGIVKKAKEHLIHERVPLLHQMAIAASVAAILGISFMQQKDESIAHDKDSRIVEVAPGVVQRVTFKKN